jgi:hypothetical protein
MAIRSLEKAEWRSFFDRMAKSLVGKRAEIEIDSLKLGSQIEAEWLPLLGIAYDPKSDILEIALDGLDHLVAKPQRLFVDVGPEGLISFEVIDGEGVSQIVKLRDPLMLTPPSPAAG